MSWECSHDFALFLLGGETPYWRKILREGHATHVGINFKSLLERMNQERIWNVSEHFIGNEEILVDAGRTQTSEFDHDSHADAYQTWVGQNIDRISLVIEYEGTGINREWIAQRRIQMLEEVPADKFLPIWREADGPEELERLCATYSRVAIVKPSTSIEGRFKSIVARYDAKIHGLGMTGPDDVAHLPLTTASSTSWISPTQYGDAQIFAGGRFHWYPKRTSEEARRRHAMDIEQAGFDSALYQAGNRKEVARYTVWAWQQYENHVAMERSRGRGQIVSIRPPLDPAGLREAEGGSVDTPMSAGRSTELVQRREAQQVFPGLSFRREVLETAGQSPDSPESRVAVPQLESSLLRVCNTCYLARRCPAYDPEASCAFKMPVEIKNRPQLMASLQALLEMQFSRVVFARAAEEMDGSVVNADTSAAITQYMQMVEKLRNIEGDPNFFRIEARGPQAQGILSQLLSQARGQRVQVPPIPVNPEMADRLIRDVIDLGESE